MTPEEQAERLRRWTTELRTTALGQVDGHLFNHPEPVSDDADLDYRVADPTITEACCLGVCLLLFAPGAATGISRWNDMDDAVPKWLGAYDPDEDGDVRLDWPREFWPRVRRRENPAFDRPDLCTHVSAAWLNDSAKCTFAQIADLLDYFGVVTDPQVVTSDG